MWHPEPIVSFEGLEPNISADPPIVPTLSSPLAKRATAPETTDTVLTPRDRAPKIRIIIVDEPGIMRDGLCALLGASDDFEVVGILADAAEALRMFATTAVDILVTDLSHTTNAGYDVIAEIKAHHPSVRVLVLTFRKDDNVIDSALRAGADGYVLKNDSRNDLFMALRNIAKGRGYISPSICDRVVSGYVRARDPERRRALARGELTERERQVIKLIAGGHRTREMATMLSLSHKTVEKHRANLMRKLGLRNASAVAAYAIANGYINF